MVRYVGLDVHKHSIVSCAVDERGKVLSRNTLNDVSAASLATFVKQHLRPDDHVALEATTNAHAVAGALEPAVARVVISNPLATKLIAHAKVKTDKVDAHALAQLLRLDYLPTIWRAEEPTARLRQWTARRSRLVSHQTAIVNRIHALLAQRLIACPFEMDSSKGRQWLHEVPLDADDRWLLDSDLRLWEALRAELTAIEQELAKRSYPDPRIRLLMTLPGVSQHVAQSLLAAIGDIARFASPRALAAYLGLVPSTHQSGNHSYHGRITKQGRGHTRWMLVQAAHCVASHPGPLGHFFRKLKARKSHNVAVVATAHKLATTAWHLLTSGTPYRYAMPASTEAKLQKFRVAATGHRRASGVPKGAMATRKVPSGSTRNVRGLDEVYASEGLPPTSPAPAGEVAHLGATGTLAFAQKVQQSRRVPRRAASGSMLPAARDSGSASDSHAPELNTNAAPPLAGETCLPDRRPYPVPLAPTDAEKFRQLAKEKLNAELAIRPRNNSKIPRSPS